MGYYNEIGWRDNVVMLNLGQSGGVSEPDFNDFIGSMKQWSFASNTEEELYITFHIDHDYLPDSEVFPHIHWTPSDTNSGTVRWGLEYSVAKGHGQQAFTTVSTTYIEQDASGIDRQHQIAESDIGILGGGVLEPDAIVMCRIFRDASNANDTYGSDAFGICVDLHYQVDRNSTPNKEPNFYN